MNRHSKHYSMNYLSNYNKSPSSIDKIVDIILLNFIFLFIKLIYYNYNNHYYYYYYYYFN